jgi:hypothetical protein
VLTAQGSFIQPRGGVRCHWGRGNCIAPLLSESSTRWPHCKTQTNFLGARSRTLSCSGLGTEKRSEVSEVGTATWHLGPVLRSPLYPLYLYIYFSFGASWRPISPQLPLAMEDTRKTITLTNAQLERVNAGDIDPILLLAGHATILDEKERSTIETLKTHWKAAVYSLILSTALIMEGYDAVIVSSCPDVRVPNMKADRLDGLVLRPACFPATLWS